jgi:hypothetical protein
MTKTKDKIKIQKTIKLTDKKIDDIINLFCIVDMRSYPDGLGIWGKDTELYSTDIKELAIVKARRKIREILLGIKYVGE